MPIARKDDDKSPPNPLRPRSAIGILDSNLQQLSPQVVTITKSPATHAIKSQTALPKSCQTVSEQKPAERTAERKLVKRSRSLSLCIPTALFPLGRPNQLLLWNECIDVSN